MAIWKLSGKDFWDIERGPQVRDFGDEAVVIGVQSPLTMSGVGTIRIQFLRTV
jgi:hypothetical protein